MAERAALKESEEMVHKDFVEVGPYPTYILPSTATTLTHMRTPFLVYFVLLGLLTAVFICSGKTKIQISFVGVAGTDPRSSPKHLVCMSLRAVHCCALGTGWRIVSHYCVQGKSRLIISESGVCADCVDKKAI